RCLRVTSLTVYPSLLSPSPFRLTSLSFFFFFNDPPTTEIYTLSLHDALPIFDRDRVGVAGAGGGARLDDVDAAIAGDGGRDHQRSEEHTYGLQSLTNLVCRLLLEKKKNEKNKQQCIENRTREHTRQSAGEPTC